MSQEVGVRGERKYCKYDFEGGESKARAPGSAWRGRQGALAGFPVSQRALVDALPLAGSRATLVLSLSSFQSAIYYFFQSIDNV